MFSVRTEKIVAAFLVALVLLFSGCATGDTILITQDINQTIDMNGTADTNYVTAGATFNSYWLSLLDARDLNNSLDYLKSGDNVSELTNDAGYITSYLDTNAETACGVGQVLSGDGSCVDTNTFGSATDLNGYMTKATFDGNFVVSFDGNFFAVTYGSSDFNSFYANSNLFVPSSAAWDSNFALRGSFDSNSTLDSRYILISDSNNVARLAYSVIYDWNNSVLFAYDWNNNLAYLKYVDLNGYMTKHTFDGNFQSAFDGNFDASTYASADFNAAYKTPFSLGDLNAIYGFSSLTANHLVKWDGEKLADAPIANSGTQFDVNGTFDLNGVFTVDLTNPSANQDIFIVSKNGGATELATIDEDGDFHSLGNFVSDTGTILGSQGVYCNGNNCTIEARDSGSVAYRIRLYNYGEDSYIDYFGDDLMFRNNGQDSPHYAMQLTDENVLFVWKGIEIIDGDLNVNGSSIANEYCIGSDCITAWSDVNVPVVLDGYMTKHTFDGNFQVAFDSNFAAATYGSSDFNSFYLNTNLFVPSSSEWDANFALRGSFDSNAVLDSRYAPIDIYVPSSAAWDSNFALRGSFDSNAVLDSRYVLVADSNNVGRLYWSTIFDWNSSVLYANDWNNSLAYLKYVDLNGYMTQTTFDGNFALHGAFDSNTVLDSRYLQLSSIKEKFSIVILPDTQYYSQDYPTLFSGQTTWIVANKDRLNIQMVIHLGDIVDDADQTSQWDAADAAMTILDDEVPYKMTPGNHDHYPNGPDGTLTNYNSYFGSSRYSGESWWGGDYNSNSNNYQLLTIEGVDFIFMGLDDCPQQAEINWADSVLYTYSDRIGILSTHDYLDLDGNRSTCGDNIWRQIIKDHANVQIVLSGHNHGEAHKLDYNDYNKPVYQIMADYQADAYGGSGFLRILTFDLDTNKFYFETYSPYLNEWGTNLGEFSLNTKMSPWAVSERRSSDPVSTNCAYGGPCGFSNFVYYSNPVGVMEDSPEYELHVGGTVYAIADENSESFVSRGALAIQMSNGQMTGVYGDQNTGDWAGYFNGATQFTEPSCGQRFASWLYNGYGYTDTGDEYATRLSTLDPSLDYSCVDCVKAIDGTAGTCTTDWDTWAICIIETVCQ